MRKVLAQWPLAVFALAALYAGDWLVLRARGVAGRGTVLVRTYYAVPAKGNKMDFSPGADENVDCARSLFPHDGLDACWRLRRHADRRVDL